MKYYIIENQIRPDGEVNTSTVSRSSFALALSYYYERCSKMVVNDQFLSVHVMLTDEKLEVVKKDDLTTLYVATSAE